MNKQIQSLILTAQQQAAKETIVNSFAYENLVYAKFAELIVKECMSVCKSRVGNSDYNTGRIHCVSDIKEHFGVEEGGEEEVFSCPACGLQNPTTTCGLPNCGLIYGVEE